MYAGHVGIALALRTHRDAPPLWLLVLAAQGPDWGEVVRSATGHPWANPATSPHALPWVAAGAVLAAVVAALVAARARRAVAAPALLAAVAYASHWPADYLTGRKPTWNGGPIVGLGLYGRPGIDLVLEGLVVALAWAIWRRALPPAAGTRARRALAWALLAALLGLQLGADLVMTHGDWLS